jgi:hypothetical protein
MLEHGGEAGLPLPCISLRLPARSLPLVCLTPLLGLCLVGFVGLPLPSTRCLPTLSPGTLACSWGHPSRKLLPLPTAGIIALAILLVSIPAFRAIVFSLGWGPGLPLLGDGGCGAFRHGDGELCEVQAGSNFTKLLPSDVLRSIAAGMLLAPSGFLGCHMVSTLCGGGSVGKPCFHVVGSGACAERVWGAGSQK